MAPRALACASGVKRLGQNFAETASESKLNVPPRWCMNSSVRMTWVKERRTPHAITAAPAWNSACQGCGATCRLVENRLPFKVTS